MNNKISVAIPHYNNSKYFRDTLGPLIKDDRVNEIVVCDDVSKDVEELKNIITELNVNNKIKLHINEKNLGCYHNKLNSLSKCSNEWAIILDSDNIVDTDYLDCLYNIGTWNDKLIYAPSWAQTFPNKSSRYMDYRKYSDATITKPLFLSLFNDIHFTCLMNTCNYFVPVQKYVNCMNQYTYNREVINSLDSAVLFSDWLKDDNFVYIVPNMFYKHRLHSDSNYMLANKRYERQVKQDMINKLSS